jgi:hypothetical protein
MLSSSNVRHARRGINDDVGLRYLLQAGNYTIELPHPSVGRLQRQGTCWREQDDGSNLAATDEPAHARSTNAMKIAIITPARRWVVPVCFWLLLSISCGAADFVELSAEIETFGYRLGDTNGIEKAKPKLVKVKCITGSTGWSIEHDYVRPQVWLGDGTNVVLRNDPEGVSLKELGLVDSKYLSTFSRNGLPLGEFGVNLPWLAFCSGTYLKREGRIMALPCGVLRHCPDRFAYTDVTTTFADELGLPRTVDLFTSKVRFLAAKTEWDKEWSFGDRYTEWNKKATANLQEGLLVFHYAVLESTNVLGRSFPTKFEFFQTGRPYEQMGDWYCQGIGRIKSIRPSTMPPASK